MSRSSKYLVIFFVILFFGLAGLTGEKRDILQFSLDDKILNDNADASIPRSQNATGPNVVEILLDDLDSNSLNVMLENNLLPNIQLLKDEGTVFNRSYVTTSLCCPSRVSGLTGQYAHNHQVFNIKPPYGGVTKFTQDSSALPVHLQNSGYRTGFIGKYLNRYGSDYQLTTETPLDDPEYVPPGWSDWQALVSFTTYNMFKYVINDNGALKQYGKNEIGYQTDILAQRSQDFIRESDAPDLKPFFLLVNPVAPHLESTVAAPLSGCENSKWNTTIRSAPRHRTSLPPTILLPEPPSFNESDMSKKSEYMKRQPMIGDLDKNCLSKVYRDRLKSLMAVDDLVGNVRGALDQIGELDNTVIILTSDNGWFNGEHRLKDKILFYEESIKVPLIISGGQLEHQDPVDKLVLNIDLAPTILEMTGATTDLQMDGRSLMPILEDPGSVMNWRKRALIEYWQTSPALMHIVAVRTSSEDAIPNAAFMTWSTGELEYYDMSQDPFQLDNSYASLDFAKTSLLETYAKRLANCAGYTCIWAENSVK